MINYSFKMFAFMKDDQGLAKVPAQGYLELLHIWTRGGTKRMFHRGADEKQNVMELGGELQEMLSYKNVALIRHSDKFSNDFFRAFQKKREFALLISFRAYHQNSRERKLVTSTLLSDMGAKITEYHPYRSSDNAREERLRIKLKEPSLSFRDLTIVADIFGDTFRQIRGTVKKNVGQMLN